VQSHVIGKKTNKQNRHITVTGFLPVVFSQRNFFIGCNRDNILFRNCQLFRNNPVILEFDRYFKIVGHIEISFSFEETGVAPEKVGHRAILLPKQVPGRQNYQKTETEGKWIVAT
jgi:hypothetical protein